MIKKKRIVTPEMRERIEREYAQIRKNRLDLVHSCMKAIKERIVKKYNAKIFLFGSYARGNFDLSRSDIDICILSDLSDNTDFIELCHNVIFDVFKERNITIDRDILIVKNAPFDDPHFCFVEF